MFRDATNRADRSGGMVFHVLNRGGRMHSFEKPADYQAKQVYALLRILFTILKWQ